jgi:hypothetical protein
MDYAREVGLIGVAETPTAYAVQPLIETPTAGKAPARRKGRKAVLA